MRLQRHKKRLAALGEGSSQSSREARQHVPIPAPFGGLHRWRGVRRECIGNRLLVLSGDEATVEVSDEGIQSLLVSGKPLREQTRRLAWTHRVEQAGQAAAGPGSAMPRS